jgi:hypothetical protein
LTLTGLQKSDTMQSREGNFDSSLQGGTDR